MCDMCDQQLTDKKAGSGAKFVPVSEAVGMILPHDITEIRPGQFKGAAFKKGHRVREEDMFMYCRWTNCGQDF